MFSIYHFSRDSGGANLLLSEVHGSFSRLILPFLGYLQVNLGKKGHNSQSLLISWGLSQIGPLLQGNNQIIMQEDDAEVQSTPIPLRNKPTQLYERREMPHVLPVLKVMARQCNSFHNLPVLRVLKDIARLFQLSHTEALFFLHLVRETDWGTEEGWIGRYAGGVRDLLCFVHEEEEYQEMVLYLLLASYSVKECLNHRQPALLHRATKICPAFPSAFSEWSRRHAKAIQDIHPRQLNRLFMELHSQERCSPPDYMAAVDEILEICTPYSEKRVELNRVRIERLRREAENQLWGARPHKLRKLEKNFEAELCATFREIGELCTEDYSEELTDTRFNELGIEMESRGRGLGERLADSEEDFCESINLCKEESSQHILFMGQERDYEGFALRFFCEDSEAHLL